MCDLTTCDENSSGEGVAATGKQQSKQQQRQHFSSKKTNAEECSQAVRDGRLTQALRSLNPRRKTGPWTILCDGESFLRAKDSVAAYRSKKIVLWAVPAKSPDLKPVEMFWGWLRQKLRTLDLHDLRLKRPPLSRMAYTARVKSVLKSQKAQAVASSYAGRFRRTCQEVVDRKGGAADN